MRTASQHVCPLYPAPQVAGQLDLALGPGFSATAIGFNPLELARDAPVSGLSCGGSFRDVAAALEKRAAEGGSPRHSLLNPVVGPEAVAGSSRMKGGTATLILADAISYRAAMLSRGSKAPTIAEAVGKAHETTRLTYEQSRSIASVCELAANAMRAGGRIYYIGEGTAGVLGCIDASEMPDTYGVPFDTVRGFVCGGWADVYAATEIHHERHLCLLARRPSPLAPLPFTPHPSLLDRRPSPLSGQTGKAT